MKNGRNWIENTMTHDSKKGAANRILVFGSEKGAYQLENQHRFLDGTFKSAPKFLSILFYYRTARRVNTCTHAFFRQRRPNVSTKNCCG